MTGEVEATELRLHAQTVRRLLMQAKLPRVKVGRRCRLGGPTSTRYICRHGGCGRYCKCNCQEPRSPFRLVRSARVLPSLDRSGARNAAVVLSLGSRDVSVSAQSQSPVAGADCPSPVSECRCL